MFLRKDWIELLREFNAASVRYLVVGAAAMAVHGEIRSTRDFDVWIDNDAENARRAYEALSAFGAPLHDLSIDDLESPDLIFQIGVDPLRIDILTDIDGVTFTEAWPNRVPAEDGGVAFPTIGLDDIIKNKRAMGRTKDLSDVEALEKLRDPHR